VRKVCALSFHGGEEMDLQPIETGRYVIQAELGRGRWGIVYRAYDPQLDRLVALKYIHLAGGDQDARLRREARIAAKLSHHHIVPVYDVIETDNTVSIVMELLAGGTLRERMTGPLLWQDSVSLLFPLCDALVYAHRQGVIHRDIKPENIMFSADSVIKLADLGLAFADSASQRTQEGEIVGTFRYAAPEQILGEKINKQADTFGRADVFALATVLYEMLTGCPLFSGTNPQDVFQKIISKSPVDLSPLQGITPTYLIDALAHALDKDPTKRDTAENFGAALRHCLGKDSLFADTTPLPAFLSVKSVFQKTLAAIKKVREFKMIENDMKQLSVDDGIVGCRPRLALFFFTVPLLLVALALVSVLLIPANFDLLLRTTRIKATLLLLIAFLIVLVSTVAGFLIWQGYRRALNKLGVTQGQIYTLEKSNAELEQSNAELEEQLDKVLSKQSGPLVYVHSDRFGDADYEIVEKLLSGYHTVRLYPLVHGFSGANVFLVEREKTPGRRMAPRVIKLGRKEQIEAEVQSYQKYVLEYFSPPPKLEGTQYSTNGFRAGFCTSYARIKGKVRTFEEFFSASKGAASEKIIKPVFSEDLLGSFLQNPQRIRRRLYREDYQLDENDWRKIDEAVKALGLPQVEDGAFVFRGHTYLNPLKKAKAWFDEKDVQSRLQVSFDTMTAIVHGDLNARNILIDDNNNVFIIDFAKTGKGHILKDFCRLEVEIKFCLTELATEDDVLRAVEWEKKLLLIQRKKSHRSLNDLLAMPKDNLGFDEITTGCIRELREYARRALGLYLTDSVGPEQYYLGLLHHTLEAIRYKQCDRNSRLFALISASLLCQALG